MNHITGLIHFIRARREIINGDEDGVRIVYRTELARNAPQFCIDQYIADRAPYFYRSLDAILRDFRSGLFLTAIQSTLSRLPTSKSFQESHFGEIVAGIFCQEILELRLLYSKLSLLTAENSNAYKMDLVMYKPSSNPLEFTFGEVKSSPKMAGNGLPANHHKSCFADLFNTMNHYKLGDQKFDLTAARDNIQQIPEPDREMVRVALLPYSNSVISYAGFVVIDNSTFSESEAQVLRTRRNSRDFEVDLICLESFPQVAQTVFESLHINHR